MSTTINPQEIQRFDQLAATWWQPDGPMWPLHKLNNLRAPYIEDQICLRFDRDKQQPNPLSGLRILDIGCGAGLLSEAMVKLGADVTALDPSSRNIEIARAHADKQKLPINYQLGGIETIADNEFFDVVLNMEVIEHVDNLPVFLDACCSHVRPGGLHFIATLNRTAMSWIVAIIGAEYILRWLPRGTHQWTKFVTPEEVELLLNERGQNVVAHAGVSINPFTKHYRLSEFLGVNYMAVGQHAQSLD